MHALSDCDKYFQRKVLNSEITNEYLMKLTEDYVENVKNGCTDDFYMQPKKPSCYPVNDQVRTNYKVVDLFPVIPQFVCVYASTKMFLRIITQIWAKKWASSGLQVFSACPGWVATELAGNDAAMISTQKEMGALNPEQGADVFWWLATTDDEDALDKGNGGFFYNGRELETRWGLE